MLRIRCIKKCLHDGRIYSPGEITYPSVDGGFSKECFVFIGKTPPKLKLPKCSGSVTLLGDGPSLQYALDNPDEINTPVAVVNKVGYRWSGKLDYWFSLHTGWLALWSHKRKKAGLDMTGIQFISGKVPLNPEVIRSPDHLRSGGGSGLYAIETLALMGFDHVHTIGIDLTDEYEMFRPSWKPEKFKVKITAHHGFLKELFS